MPKHLTSALQQLWGTLLLILFLGLAARAYSPLARLWEVKNLEQPGQLTIFNSAPGGGYDGLPVEMGDLDGDGFRDLVVAPMAADTAGGARRMAGEIHVYRGDGQLQGVIDRGVAESLPRNLTIQGARAGDYLGTELFVADLNGDKIDDLAFSSQNYDGFDGTRDTCGGAFILFGRKDLLAESKILDLANPDAIPGLVKIAGPSVGGRLGIWVEAGDLDDDGFDDLLVGADQFPNDDPLAPRLHTGEVFVIYGRAEWPLAIDLTQPPSGTSRIIGADSEDHFGSCIHSRDLNKDGRSDLVISAALNRLSASRNPGGTSRAHSSGAGDGPQNSRADCGDIYVFFGPRDGGRLPPLIDLSQPLSADISSRLTRIYGPAALDGLGEELTSGDFNGDGYFDLAIGALLGANPQGLTGGFVSVIYWQEGLEGTVIDLSPAAKGTLPQGLKVSEIYGTQVQNLVADTLSAGDVNHDGIDDLIVGIPHEKVGNFSKAGVVAIAFGRTQAWPELWTPQAEVLPPELDVAFILGAEVEDLLSYSMEAKDYDNDGYVDIFPNAMRGEGGSAHAVDAGQVYLVSGHALSGKPVEILSVMPASGPQKASTKIEIAGNGFTTSQDTRVFVGQDAVEQVRVLTSSRLEGVVPPGSSAGKLDVRVENRYGSQTLKSGFERLAGSVFLRGDSNLSGNLDLSDAVRTLNGLFRGQGLACPDASDADDSGHVDTTDVVFTLGFLFLGDPPPPEPYPAQGSDPTPDDLDCP